MQVYLSLEEKDNPLALASGADTLNVQVSAREWTKLGRYLADGAPQNSWRWLDKLTRRLSRTDTENLIDEIIVYARRAGELDDDTLESIRWCRQRDVKLVICLWASGDFRFRFGSLRWGWLRSFIQEVPSSPSFAASFAY